MNTMFDEDLRVSIYGINAMHWPQPHQKHRVFTFVVGSP